MLIETSLTSADLNDVGPRAAALEVAGYDVLTTQENRHDPYLPLAVAATTTTTSTLATSVAIAFPRSPMITANVGWDLQRASRGRFELGLGSQVKGHNERRFSVPWSAPAPRMQEYVAAVRAIWRSWHEGEPLAFAGEHYGFSLMPPNFTPEPLVDGMTPPASPSLPSDRPCSGWRDGCVTVSASTRSAPVPTPRPQFCPSWTAGSTSRAAAGTS
ncbi:MAG: LLM class flavin-dependent oxidoreductase [Actinomycetota bacterium]